MGNEGRAALPFQLSEEVCGVGASAMYHIWTVLRILLSFFYIKQMHSLGLYSRIDQVFDAPNAVKEVLTGQFGLDHSVCFLSFLLLLFFVIDLSMWAVRGAELHDVGKLRNVVSDYICHMKLISVPNLHVLDSVHRVQGNWSKGW